LQRYVGEVPLPDQRRRPATKLTDPKALRALAHPVRLTLMGLLRTDGPLTATRAAELTGESSGSTSFHLRQLAKYGLIEEAAGGQGRERPWRAAEQFTDLPAVARDPKVAAASSVLSGVIAEFYFANLRRWLATRDDEPEEWQRAEHFGDKLLYVTAAELAELRTGIEELVDEYLDRTADPALRPPGARLVSFLQIAHPQVGAGAAGRAGPAPDQAAGDQRADDRAR
jgi:predicted transcriptional regulator